MKKYIKPSIKTRAIDTESNILDSSITMYGKDNPIQPDDPGYTEAAKPNNWASYNPWGDDEQHFWGAPCVRPHLSTDRQIKPCKFRGDGLYIGGYQHFPKENNCEGSVVCVKKQMRNYP